MRPAALAACLLAAGCGHLPDRAIGLLPVSPLFETDSPQPTLRWESLPVPDAEGVVYDLRVHGPGGYVLESRDDLTAPEYTLSQKIHTGGEYRWTVRARFTLQGQPRATPWTEVPPYRSRSALPDGQAPKGVPLFGICPPDT